MRRGPFWGWSQTAAGAEPEAAAPRGLDLPGRPVFWRPHLPRRDMYADWQMMLRGSLDWFAVLSARRAVPGRRCPPEPEQAAADGPGRPGTRARENRGACAAARPGRGTGRHRTASGSGPSM